MRRGVKTANKTSVVLRLPCELVGRCLLPLIKAMLAKELVGRYGMSQIKTAEVLGVTQPAVSMYVSSDIPVKGSEMERCLEEVRRVVSELADGISHNEIDQIDAMRKVCSLCIWLRRGGPICKIHEGAVPTLRMESCSFCLRDLGAEKRMRMEEFEILTNVRRGVRLIEGSREFVSLIPEIGTNLAMAKPDAKTIQDVVGVQGRIHPVATRPKATGSPEFGGSSHVASAVLTAMKFDRSVRAAINLKSDRAVIDTCEDIGLKISFFDRSEEPPEIKSVDGRTIPWGITKAIERLGTVPDVVYDFGDVGKEPMLFLFRATAFDAAYLAVRIVNEYRKRKLGPSTLRRS